MYGRSCAPFTRDPPMTTLYVTVGQHQHQDDNIATIQQTAAVTSRAHTCVFVCVALCRFIPRVDLCVHHRDRDTELLHHHKAPSCRPF